MAVTINEGTQTDILTTQVGGTEAQIVRLDIGTGASASDFGGTILAVKNLEKGTITSLETLPDLPGGTIDLISNLATGTVQTIGLRHEDEFATVVTTGTSDLGTIKAAVAGSQIFVTSMAISVGSATNVEIGDGGTANNIAGTFYLNKNGGAMLTFDPPIRTSAGSALVYKQSTAISEMSITVTGYVD